MRGDHIYVRRFGGFYAHHGIDAGDGTVIHYTSSHWMTPRQVRRTSLDLFAGNDTIYIRDYTKFLQKLEKGDLVEKASQDFNQWMDRLRGIHVESMDFSADAVMSRAESRLGEFAFDIIFNNCEHFATWCKTGISNSEQVNELWRQVLSPAGFAKYRSSQAMTDFVEIPWRRLK